MLKHPDREVKCKKKTFLSLSNRHVFGLSNHSNSQSLLCHLQLNIEHKYHRNFEILWLLWHLKQFTSKKILKQTLSHIMYAVVYEISSI